MESKVRIRIRRQGGVCPFYKRQGGVPRSSLCSYNIWNKVWFFSSLYFLSLSLPYNRKDLEFSGIDSFKVFQLTKLQIGELSAVHGYFIYNFCLFFFLWPSTTRVVACLLLQITKRSLRDFIEVFLVPIILEIQNWVEFSQFMQIWLILFFFKKLNSYLFIFLLFIILPLLFMFSMFSKKQIDIAFSHWEIYGKWSLHL